jgi:acyl-CoA synthetase (AMP-forming)/AMP-acid ligase II
MSVQLAGFMVLQNTAAAMGVPIETIMANMPQQALLQVYPLFHISGLGAAFLSPLSAGSKVVVVGRWDAADAMQLIENEQITQFTAVPTMLWDMLRVARERPEALSSLRNIGTGGQALPVALLDAMRELCPQAVMGTGYGMTETSGSVAMAVGEDYIRNRAAAGRKLPMVEMKILNPAGEEMPPGEAGEICVRGATVMKEYWNRPKETDQALSDDGWLATGDIGYLDAEDYVFIVDRKKDMVISGGENIYCAEVEQVLGAMPGVSECAAFGLPDERLGERLVVMAVAEGQTPEAMITQVEERLARYKAPSELRLVSGPLPRNVLGKIDKLALRKQWANTNAASN